MLTISRNIQLPLTTLGPVLFIVPSHQLSHSLHIQKAREILDSILCGWKWGKGLPMGVNFYDNHYHLSDTTGEQKRKSPHPPTPSPPGLSFPNFPFTVVVKKKKTKNPLEICWSIYKTPLFCLPEREIKTEGIFNRALIAYELQQKKP